MIVRSFRVSSVTTALSALAMIGAVACSSSSSSGGGASSSSNFIDSYCSYVATCCGAEGTPSDGSQCRALFSLTGGTYDANAGSACLAVVKQSSEADASWCADPSTSNPPECNAVYKKTGQASNVAPGGKCSSDSDCAAAPSGDTVSCREYFGDDGGSNVQVCQVIVPGKVGDTCNGESNSTGGTIVTSYFDEGDSTNPPSQLVICADTDGLQCMPNNDGTSATTYACTALGKVGDACSSDGSCTIDDYCDFAGGKCAARAADGSSCSSGGQECVQTDYCDDGSSTCIAKAKAGAACGTSAECQSNDCSNGKCGAGLSSIGLAFLCGGSSN